MEICVKFGRMGLPQVEPEPETVTRAAQRSCFYGGVESLPPHLHLLALRSGRRDDTPPVGRQDSLLKATGGGHAGPRDSRTLSAASPGGEDSSSGWTEAHYYPLVAEW